MPPRCAFQTLFLTARALRGLWVALRVGDFRDKGGGVMGVAVRVRGISGGGSRSLGSMFDGSMDVDAGDVDVGVACGPNRRIMDNRLGIME